MNNRIFIGFPRIARLCVLMLATVALTAVGQESVSMFTIDAGYASIHDSYLTPITYGGFDLAMGYEAMRPSKRQWLWQLQVGRE